MKPEVTHGWDAETPEAREPKTLLCQKDVMRAMTVEQRWRVAEMLYWSARNLKAATLCSLHPDWTSAEVESAVRRSFSRVER